MEEACVFSDHATGPAQLILLGHALDQAGTPVIVTDPSGFIVWVNRAYLSLTGLLKPDLLGANASLLDHENAHSPYASFTTSSLARRGPWRRERSYTRRDGSSYITDEVVAPLFNEDGELSHFVVTMHDITTSKEALKRQRLLNNHDVLTGLVCRSHITELVPEAIASAHQLGRTLAMLFIDLDRFKAINDGFGHHVGDMVLKAVGSRLQGAVRSSDTVARFGGDEFVILLPTIARRSVAQRLGNKIVKLAAEPFAIGTESHQLSASVGIAFYPEDGSSFDDLLISADTAMYAAKRNGGNQARLAQAGTSSLASPGR